MVHIGILVAATGTLVYCGTAAGGCAGVWGMVVLCFAKWLHPVCHDKPMPNRLFENV